MGWALAGMMPPSLLATLLLLLTSQSVFPAAVVGTSSDGGVTLQPPDAASDEPPAGDVTDAERLLFASRSPTCTACQRMVLYLDETLLPRAFDEKAKRNTGAASRTGASDPSAYGRYEALVEEEVSRVCQVGREGCESRGRVALRVALHDAHWPALYREPMTGDFASSSSIESRCWCCGPFVPRPPPSSSARPSAARASGCWRCTRWGCTYTLNAVDPSRLKAPGFINP
jgi:hypothetical protein